MVSDFQIIGGGLMGLSTAYALQKRGASVRIIEAREGVGLETSYANAGMLHAFNAAPWNRPGVTRQLLSSLLDPSSAMKLRANAFPSIFKWGIEFIAASRPEPHWHATKNNYALADTSIKYADAWCAELNMQIDTSKNGLLNIARSEREFAAARKLTEKLEPIGFQVHALNVAETVAKEPALAPIADQLVGSFYYPDDYSADAFKFCKALEKALIDNECEIITGSKASGFLREYGTVIGVKTEAESYQAQTTIVAAGARTANLVRPLGLKLALRPVKGYSLTFQNLPGPVLPVIDDNLHAAVTPLGNRLRVAGTAEFTGFNPSLPRHRLAPLLGMLQSIYPEHSQGLTLDDATPWCGFRPMSADGLPFIGATKIKGLAVNSGQGHMGWTLCAGSAELLADLLLSNQTTIEATAFDPMR
ncbi:MAG: FAD-dependent oxidoreductase [Acidimicrobiales bacterium]|nr:MAG: FAD-dependent oxidoreductase [Acidimicrobiales bacterium]